MSLITLGLTKIEVGAIAVDGGMSTTLATLGYTHADSCKMVTEDPTVTEHYAEEVDDPVASVSKKGKTIVTWSIMDPDADALADVLGGTATLGVWESPDTQPIIEKSVKITPNVGFSIEIPRASITGKINAEFSKKGIFLVDMKATVMMPTKAATKAIKTTPLV